MTYTQPPSGLPDPDLQPEFYADTTLKRFLAWVVDTILITLICIVAIPLTAFVGLFFFAGLFLIVNLIYRIVTITRHSATPGMRLMAIEFRDRTGARFDLTTASLHTLLYMGMASVVILQVISIILMLAGSRGQGLHDHLLGTAAINRPDTA
jgi:uncharacterized RDD family membrane protein YckC